MIRQLFLSVMCLLWGTCSQAQTNATHDLPIYKEAPVVTEELIHYREVMPIFEGCEEATNPCDCSDKQLMNAVYTHLRYPEAAYKAGTEGMVILTFKIEKDGTISKLNLLRDPGNGLGEEALRVLRILQKEYTWTPARQYDKIVSVRYNLPVRFRLDTTPPAEPPPIDR